MCRQGKQWASLRTPINPTCSRFPHGARCRYSRSTSRRRAGAIPSLERRIFRRGLWVCSLNPPISHHLQVRISGCIAGRSTIKSSNSRPFFLSAQRSFLSAFCSICRTRSTDTQSTAAICWCVIPVPWPVSSSATSMPRRARQAIRYPERQQERQSHRAEHLYLAGRFRCRHYR